MSRRIFQFTWRSWVEAVLLFFSVGGLVQYGSTKGTNGNDRSQDAGLLRGYAQPLAPLAVDSTGFSVPADFPPVTNLCFWGIERGSNSVLFGLSWPEALSFTNAAIDLYGSARLVSNGVMQTTPLKVEMRV